MVGSGLLALWTAGAQTIWVSFYLMYIDSHTETRTIHSVVRWNTFFGILPWFVGIGVGAAIGAFLHKKCSVKIVYVSMSTQINP